MSRPQRTDALIAVALAAASVGEIALLDGFEPASLLVGAIALPLAWRRTAPAAALLACAALLLVVAVSPTTLDNSLPILAFVLAVFSFGVRASRRTLLLVYPVVIVLVEFAVAGTEQSEVFANAVFTALAYLGLPMVAARIVRSRTALTRRLAEQAEALERERESHAARAAAQERTRMAAELHDLVAAGVRAMLDEVDVAERSVDADPVRCRTAIAHVEERGRDTLVDMRRLLGVLRREDEDLALAPQPSLARLGALAAQHERQGRPVRLHVEGDAHELTPGVDVAAYRIVEEALAAVPGRGEVIVRWAPGHVDLEVRGPDGAFAEAGRLAATRERVELFGGRVRAGRTPQGGSAFLAQLPTRDREVVA